MPVWYEQTKDLRESGQLALVGLIQEQHPDRCALFMQWQGMDFPVLVDALNRSGVWAVPLYWAIDEHGMLRATRPGFKWLRDEFVPADYPEPAGGMPTDPEPLETGVAEFLSGDWKGALAAFGKPFRAAEGLQLNVSGPGVQSFRMGCAFRARYDSPERRPDDFQLAVESWSLALENQPQNYIWRRRIQQYGPLLGKPYPFYDWIAQARRELRARKQEPHPLVVEPGLTETLGKRNPIAEAGPPPVDEPDPQGKLPRDAKGLVEADITVVPSTLKPGQPARVHLSFRPSKRWKAHWDNEAGVSPRLWVDLPEGWQRSQEKSAWSVPPAPESADTRVLEFELVAPRAGRAELQAYVTYFVCEEANGVCQYLRQDLEIPVVVRE